MISPALALASVSFLSGLCDKENVTLSDHCRAGSRRTLVPTVIRVFHKKENVSELKIKTEKAPGRMSSLKKVQ